MIDKTALPGLDLQSTEAKIQMNNFWKYLDDLAEKNPEELRAKLHGYEGRICTIDARAISQKHLGAYFPNTPMLAAVVAVSKCVDPYEFLKDMETSYRHKFAKKPQVVEGNLKCLSEAMKGVKG